MERERERERKKERGSENGEEARESESPEAAAFIGWRDSGTVLIGEYHSADAWGLGIGQGQSSIAHVQAKGDQPHTAIPNMDLITSKLQDRQRHNGDVLMAPYSIQSDKITFHRCTNIVNKNSKYNLNLY